MTTLILKKCKICGEEKEIKLFPKHGNNIKYSCKECVNKLSKEWYKKNASKGIEASKQWRKNNPESVKKHNGYRIKRNILNLSNDYVINVLNTYKLGLLKKDIPDILIEVKRELINLRRLIKEKSSQQSESV